MVTQKGSNNSGSFIYPNNKLVDNKQGFDSVDSGTQLPKIQNNVTTITGPTRFLSFKLKLGKREDNRRINFVCQR